MRRRVFALVGCTFLCFCSNAAAGTTLTGVKRPWMDSCVAMAPTPNVSLEVRQSPSGASYADADARVIYIGDLDEDDCHVILHEVGHVYDKLVLDNGERQRFACSIMGERGVPLWWGKWENGVWTGGEAKASALERFAEVYAIANEVSPRPKSYVDRGVQYGAARIVTRHGYWRWRKLLEVRRFLVAALAGAGPRDDRPLTACEGS